MSPITHLHPEPVDWIVFIALPTADVYLETYARDAGAAIFNATSELCRECPTVDRAMILEREAYEAEDLSACEDACSLGQARITAIHKFPPGAGAIG